MSEFKLTDDHKLPIPVTVVQIEQASANIRAKIRTCIQEMHYQYQPGHIAGMMRDLMALRSIQALDAGAEGIVMPVKVDDRDVRRKQQAAVKAADSAERKRLGAV